MNHQAEKIAEQVELGSEVGRDERPIINSKVLFLELRNLPHVSQCRSGEGLRPHKKSPETSCKLAIQAEYPTNSLNTAF